MATAKSKSTVDRILRYCSMREEAARAKNDRWSYLHWQSVRLIIIEAFYGEEPNSYRFRQSPQPCYIPQPKRKTTYQIENERKPMRRVVRTHTVTRPRIYGVGTEVAYVEELACGHRLPVRSDYFGETKAKQRRCPECVPRATVTDIAIGKQVSA